MSFTGLVGYAAPEELMNDTFESGFGAWKGVGSSLSLSTKGLTPDVTAPQTGVRPAVLWMGIG